MAKRKLTDLDVLVGPVPDQAPMYAVVAGVDKRILAGVHVATLDADGKVKSSQLPDEAGQGDMLKSDYDPANVAGQVLKTADVSSAADFLTADPTLLAPRSAIYALVLSLANAHTHLSAAITDSSAVGRALLTAPTAAAQLTALGLTTATLLNAAAAAAVSLPADLAAKTSWVEGAGAPTEAPATAPSFYRDNVSGNLYFAKHDDAVADWEALGGDIAVVAAWLEACEDEEDGPLILAAIKVLLEGMTAEDKALFATEMGVPNLAALTPFTAADLTAANAGASTTTFLNPSILRQSYVAMKDGGWAPFRSDQAVATGNGTVGYIVPASMNGHDLLTVTIGQSGTKGTGSGTLNCQLRRLRLDAEVDMLSANVSLAVGTRQASNGTIDAANNDLLTGDILFVDVDGNHSTPGNGLSICFTTGKPTP